MICPACGWVTRRNLGQDLFLSIGLVALVPLVLVVGTGVLGSDFMRNMSLYLAAVFIGACVLAFNIASAAFSNACVKCNRPVVRASSNEGRKALAHHHMDLASQRPG